MAHGWQGLGAAAIAVAVTIGGCGPHKGGNGDNAGPHADAQAQAPQFHHAQLKVVADKIQEALQGAGGSAAAAGPAAAATPDYATAMGQAAKVVTGGQWILEDRPANVPDEARAKYEGLIEKMKQDAADLQAACDKQQAVPARRSFIRMTNSCVTCHNTFGVNAPAMPAAPAAPAAPAGGDAPAPAGGDAPAPGAGH